MDIIVTTPKSEMENSAREAADCIRAGGGEYFRRFHREVNVEPGDRVYYVEDGYIRGFAVVDRTTHCHSMNCETTRRDWPAGFYVFMKADTWHWIEPIQMRGFQGWRCAANYVTRLPGRPISECFYPSKEAERLALVVIVGGWLDARPEI